jgi:hypothetical protein
VSARREVGGRATASDTVPLLLFSWLDADANGTLERSEVRGGRVPAL